MPLETHSDTAFKLPVNLGFSDSEFDLITDGVRGCISYQVRLQRAPGNMHSKI